MKIMNLRVLALLATLALVPAVRASNAGQNPQAIVYNNFVLHIVRNQHEYSDMQVRGFCANPNFRPTVFSVGLDINRSDSDRQLAGNLLRRIVPLLDNVSH